MSGCSPLPCCSKMHQDARLRTCFEPVRGVSGIPAWRSHRQHPTTIHERRVNGEYSQDSALHLQSQVLKTWHAVELAFLRMSRNCQGTKFVCFDVQYTVLPCLTIPARVHWWSSYLLQTNDRLIQEAHTESWGAQILSCAFRAQCIWSWNARKVTKLQLQRLNMRGSWLMMSNTHSTF